MHTAARVLLWTLGVVLVVALLGAIVPRVFDWNVLKDELAALLGERLGTEVAIGGGFDLDYEDGTIRLQAKDVRVGGALPSPRPLLALGRLSAAVELRPLLEGDLVLDHVVLRQPQLSLTVTEDGEANWDLQEGAEPADRPGVPTLPAIERLEIQGGSITYRDEAVDRTIHAAIGEIVARMTPERALRARGSGEIESRELRFEARAEPIPDTGDWRVSAQAALADARLSIDGSVAPPDLNVTLRAPRPRQLGIPPLPDIVGAGGLALSTRVITDEGQWLLDGLDLALGERRISGDVRIAAGQEPMMIYATLHLDELPLPGDEDEDERDELIPPAPLPTDELALANLQANLSIGRIANSAIALEDVELRVELADGRLVVRPASIDLAGGELEGRLVYDTSVRPPALQTHLVLRQLDLALLAAGEDDAVTGETSGTINLRGRGATLEALAGNLDGQLLFVMREGSIDASLVEALGLDLAEWLITITAPERVRTRIRCAMIAFDAQDGVLSAEPVVIDTRDSLIVAEGQIGLGTEQMRLTLRAYPKDPSLLTIDSRIRIAGALSEPSIDVLGTEAAGQGAIAAALAALAGPLAALVPFIDAGTVEDQNCARLVGDVPFPPVPDPRQ